MRQLKEVSFTPAPIGNGRTKVLGLSALGAAIIVAAVVAVPRQSGDSEPAESSGRVQQGERTGRVNLATISPIDLQRAIDQRLDYIVREYRERGKRQFFYVGAPTVTSLGWDTEYQRDRFHKQIIMGLLDRGYVARPSSIGAIFNIDD